ncbi:MAG: 23S rRNA (guanosine(2251)-2'-O)-methyltransferase RlmB [Bacteroidales bacterium]|nr:23S rRNA (guanosine(2251)-2'-O)-methyltransferase RlmB [Bacteroidales bacterium]
MKNKKQIVGGIHPVLEAINAGREFNRIYIRKGLNNDQFKELFRYIRERRIPFQYVPVEKLNRISNINHQGVIAELSIIEYKSIEEIVQRTFEEGRDPLIVILDQLTDVRNFGAIARTAECSGVDALVIPSQGSVSITPDAIKSSAGALHRVNVCRSEKLTTTVQYLRNSGIQIVAATEKANDLYFTADMTGPLAIILGSEEKGISQPVLQNVDKLIKIPLFGNVQSLNVSVACGIILFETIRQKSFGS